jgi:hypothetical protein
MRIAKNIRIMPLGMYKGWPVETVPVGWLHWYWHNAGVGGQKHINIIAHIREHMDAIKSADPALVWTEEPLNEEMVIRSEAALARRVA